MPNPSITVIILTYNQRETTLACVESLIAGRRMPFNILVWDNGSNDGTLEALETAFPEVRVHCHTENLGVAGGRNAAAQLAICDMAPTHLLFLDNDMVVEPGFVAALHAPFREALDIGQTQAKLRFMHDRQRLNDGGGCRINFMLGRTRPVGYGEIDHGQYDRIVPCISCGGAMLVRREIFEQLGGFDLTFNPFGPEDLDFSLRLQKAGYRALYAPGAVAYHAVSHTFGGGYSEDYARHKSRHWLVFLKRHAPLWQQVVFYTITAPWLFLKVLFREIRKGNPAAVRGVLQGVLRGGKAERK